MFFQYRAPKPLWVVLPAAIGMWTAVGLLMFLVARWITLDDGFFAVCRTTLESENPRWIYFLFPLGVVMGLIHYWLLLARRRKQSHSGKGKLRVAFCVMALITGCWVALMNKSEEFQRAGRICMRPRMAEELEALVAKGEVREAVRRMEDACREYQEFARKGIPEGLKATVMRRGANGMGYFFCTLAYGWETLALNMPRGVHDYLDRGPTYGSGVGGVLEAPQQWKPLGLAMADSEVAIIRVLGLWLLEDVERFTTEIYRQYDSGDQSFRALSHLVSLRYDGYSDRAIRRLLAYGPWPENHEEGMADRLLEEDRMWAIHAKAVFLVNLGEELSDIAPELGLILPGLTHKKYFNGRIKKSFSSLSHLPFPEVQERIDASDMEGAVLVMERLCGNHTDLRKRLGQEFRLLAGYSKSDPSLWAEEGYELNMPMAVKLSLDRMARDEKELGEQRSLAQAMTGSKVPILRILGHSLLKQKEEFVTEVYRQFDAGDATFRTLYTEAVFQHDSDARRQLHRLVNYEQPTVDTADNPISYTEQEKIVRIHTLTYALVGVGEEFGEDLDRIGALLVRFTPPRGNNKENYQIPCHPLIEVRRAKLQALIDAGDVDGAVRLMEIACKNLRNSRDKLGDGFLDFSRRSNFKKGVFPTSRLPAEWETQELNVPKIVRDCLSDLINYMDRGYSTTSERVLPYFDKAFPDGHEYRDKDGRTLLMEPEKTRKLAARMTQSSTPILRALGFYLLEDRPNFISTVYATHDSGDKTFTSLRRLIEETMDPNHVESPPEPAEK